MRSKTIVETIDTHTAGQPTRIIQTGLDWRIFRQNSVSDAREYFITNHDSIREMLMKEPRGHDDMYGAVVLPPTREDTDFGVFFMHAGGYDDACIHGSIGVVTALIETDQLTPDDELKFETPAGVSTARPILKDGKVVSVTIDNVPSFVVGKTEANISILDSCHSVSVDLIYSGNHFALVDLDSIPPSIKTENTERLSKIANSILKNIDDTLSDEIYSEEKIENIDFVQFYENKSVVDKSIVVFGDENIDRSPCGTGTSARMTLLHNQGKLEIGEEYQMQSLLGTEFTGYIIDSVNRDGRNIVYPSIKGSAYLTGSHTFQRNPGDPINGFSISRI